MGLGLSLYLSSSLDLKSLWGIIIGVNLTIDPTSQLAFPNFFEILFSIIVTTSEVKLPRAP